MESVRESVAIINRRLQAIHAVTKEGEDNEPVRKLVRGPPEAGNGRGPQFEIGMEMIWEGPRL